MADEDRPLETAKTALESELPEEVNEVIELVLDSRHGPRDTLDLEKSGYVVTTLQAGLYHGLTADSAEEAIVNAVMMGGDTDTIGAVAGAVAGTRFGVDALPERWLDSLAVGNELDTLASQLLDIEA
ncbi:ADP-ribosylglycohydrolase family protein [Saliphagus infecundisoli]|uniref:ADP-ribosylglycohydrolase family protein n=1 Tax=Saliphagus infecundisoli TaxID=1849069 RepID=A0ABD5QJY6_9EURY|nr:ADP-ribosylglycohydrolase family protein [Saliphagus infecundisoli]